LNSCLEQPIAPAIESLFQKALERDPGERNAWLREACQGDSDLRREVASLLANHQAATDSRPWAAAAAAKLIDRPGLLGTGQCLGPYRIESFLAAGGMGEVYRATDTRLHRQVAIKVSAGRFTERFEREARMIASLNHPNICQLHDVGPNYLVMELVEGPTLAERLRQGRVPLDEAIAIARQIAEALEAAHERGRVHRDLKPANIKITPEGVVKVLDFGLAKAIEEPSAAEDPSDSPTQTMSATRAGVILGTAAYMSPEQARGAMVDKRSDIWSLGVVLYEMLTGQQTFRGETVTDILASVMKERPDLTLLPVSVRIAVARCLSKDPRQRWGSIGDVRWALENAQVQPPPPAKHKRHTAWWIAAAVLLAVVTGWLLRPTSKPEQPMFQFEIPAPAGFTLPTVGAGQLALSPDGRRLAFLAAGRDGKRLLWLRPLSNNAASSLPGTEDAIFPFWSDDSRWLGFFADGKLQRIDLAGGRPQVICETASVRGGTWNSAGVILFGDDQGNIQSVSAAGGAPSIVFAGTERSLHFPHFLPDGKRFVAHMTGKETGVVVGSLNGKTRLFPFPPASYGASYAPNPAGGGWILYRGTGAWTQLMAQPFDPDKGKFIGEAAAISDTLVTWTASANGVLAFRHASSLGSVGESQLTWFDRNGNQLGVAGDPGTGAPGAFPRISPNLKTIAFVRRDGLQVDIWLFDTTRGVGTRLTSAPGVNTIPNWSPDGSRIFYGTRDNARNGNVLLERQSNGLGGETVITSQPAGQVYPTGVSPDGRWLVVQEDKPPASS
jgi:Tol biopolymer transport system component